MNGTQPPVEEEQARVFAELTQDEDLISKNPDLVFIELSINDMYDVLTGEESNRYFETLFRKLYLSNPNVDIAIIFTTDIYVKGELNEILT